MIIVPIIIALLVGVAVYFMSGILITDSTKTIRVVSSVCIFLILAGFFTYKIYKGVHTLPEGAYYIDGEDLTDEGVLKEQDEADGRKDTE